MEPKISIIVPVYNVEKYLNRCLESIVGQTYPNLEIILVDDGSPDNCPRICDEWSKKDSRIRVIHQENKGISATRDAGLRAAQGEYIYFVDSDDWIAPDLCEKVLNVISSNDADIVIFDCEQITGAGKKCGGTEKLKDGEISVNDALEELMRGNINNYLWNKMYKREIFQDISFPAGRAFEDVAVTYKLILKAKRIFCINERFYYYYRHQDSITGKINARKLCDLFLARYECYVNLHSIYPDIAEIIYPRVALCAIRLYDRSLWEATDEVVLNAAIEFLRKNKEKILKTKRSTNYRMYFVFPGMYKALRLLKHYTGSLVRLVKKK